MGWKEGHGVDFGSRVKNKGGVRGVLVQSEPEIGVLVKINFNF